MNRRASSGPRTVFDRRRAERDRGIALILVLVILAALLTLAVPFSWSMRNHREAAEIRLGRSQVEADMQAVLDMTQAALAQTRAQHDSTPAYDDQTEFDVNMGELRRLFDLQGGQTKTRKIWSARTQDLSGLVDLRSASIQLLGNLLGLAAVFSRDITEEAEVDEVMLDDAKMFPDSGILWADGELIGYGSRKGNRLRDISRAMVTEIFAPPEPPAPRKHRAGALVVDYRVWLLATYLFNYRPGAESELATVDEVMNVSRYGEEAFESAQVDRIRDLATVSCPWPSSRWTNPQGIARELSGGLGQDLWVLNGNHYATGSIVRISGPDGVRDYGFVINSRPARRGSWRIHLALPAENDYQRDQAVVECLVRHPVNVNTAPRGVMVALLSHLRGRWDWDNSYVDRALAEEIADRMIAARPFKGFEDLDQFLDSLVEDGRLHPTQAGTIYLNAYNSQDYLLVTGTAPFCFSSAATFRIDAAVSDNYAASLRERARLFASEIASVAPRGPLTAAYLTQRDFLEAFRLTRQARGWVTMPQNLHLFDNGDDPPRDVRGDVVPGWNLDRYPSTEPKEAGLALAPVRLDDPRDQARVIHFDEPPYISDSIEGRDLKKEGALGLDTSGGVARMVAQSAGAERFMPFAVSLWWIPDNTGAEHVLFDSGVTDAEDRVVLRYDQGELRFQIFDHGWPRLLDSGQPTAAEWHYDFGDGLPFEAKVPYHVTAFAKGTRPGEQILFIDGIPRGAPRFLSRLSQGIDDARQQDLGGFLDSRPVSLDDQAGLPARNDVVRVGRELIEYSSASGGKLTLGREGKRVVRLHEQSGTGRFQERTIHAFGGRGARFTPAPARPGGTSASLYGYCALLASREIPQGEATLASKLGPFRVARIDYRKSNEFKDISRPPDNSGGGPRGAPIIIGKGLTPQMDRIPVSRLDGNPLEDDAFQADGGYALVVTAGAVRDNRGRNVEGQAAQDGSYINGPEVIFYGSFDSGNGFLLSVMRGPALAKSPLAPPDLSVVAGGQGQGGQGQGGRGNVNLQFLAARSHVVQRRFTDPSNGVETYPGTFVVPISIQVPAAGQFADPRGGGGRGGQGGGARGRNVRSEMVQIDLDFDDPERNSTEWVRYNAIVQNRYLIRDDLENLARTYLYLRNRWDEWQTNQARPLDNMDEQDVRDEFDEINYEVALDIDNNENPRNNNRLAFRGVLGTYDCEHAQGALVLPVFRTYKFGQATGAFAHPGRHDRVTAVNAGNTRREEAEINYAWCGWSEDDPNSRRAHVAFREGMTGVFRRAALNNNYNSEDPLEVIANDVTLSESRAFTRLLKFPSGELPADNPNQVFVGGDMRGKESRGGGFVDEVRFWRPDQPHEYFRHGCYVLRRDLEESEEESLYLRTRMMRFPHLDLSRDTVAAYAPFNNLPGDGGLLLIDGEVVGYNEKGPNGELRLAPYGRAMFSDEPGNHPEDSTAIFLSFVTVSRLASAMSATQGTIDLANANDFPDRGAVLIDGELIIYDRKDPNNVLAMAQRRTDTLGGKPEGILRGRYGTLPAGHEEGTLVILMPVRVWDRYEAEVDDPALAPFEISLPARRGFFHSLAWKEEIPDARTDLVAYARVGGRVPWDADPDDWADLFRFDDPQLRSGSNRLDRQGDMLEVRFYVQFKDGAFDARTYRSNSWKRTPILRWIAVDYFQDTVVERYEEERK